MAMANGAVKLSDIVVFNDSAMSRKDLHWSQFLRAALWRVDIETV